jgi:hypothetical protein
MPSVRGGDHAKERESMIFYAIFWSTYVPFVVLTLSLLAERLTHHAERDGATEAKRVPVSAKLLSRAHKDAGLAR